MLQWKSRRSKRGIVSQAAVKSLSNEKVRLNICFFCFFLFYSDAIVPLFFPEDEAPTSSANLNDSAVCDDSEDDADMPFVDEEEEDDDEKGTKPVGK